LMYRTCQNQKKYIKFVLEVPLVRANSGVYFFGFGTCDTSKKYTDF
jgi:hypothetical protein